uniref:F-box associated domain-containing protein n=1 Tax=Aegilops tauschii subsp. strangulata TaxID=200361 RepID=A0A453IV32_AEGTS
TWNAAVLCAKDGCEHLYCHGGPFLVALVGSDRGRQITFATVYSSATRKWSGMISVKEWNVVEMTGHNAVVGNKAYFPCEQSDSVVEYDMGEQKLSVIGAPFGRLVGAEGGLLLFATVLKPRLHLHIWSMEVRPDRTTALARRRIIELAPKLSGYAFLDVSVVGFAEGVGVIFLSTKAGLYTVELSSSRIKNMDRERSLGKIMPYMCFYTRGMGAVADL